ncbi:hypothetical protein PI124_g23090 [Phytophthora idaei]|nr:hypothetical protein PI125_g25110 [Phytophthora idaei]KAG3158556.1 hypothetical protein PI126_g7807 [Phytophthora idaei]KAG3231815.1 hypothetical protein PI124_g23090 [Phytophthora idaei]
MEMDACVDHLLFLQQSAEDKFVGKVERVGVRYNKSYGGKMTTLATFATHHACNLVEKQYNVRLRVDYKVTPDKVSPTCMTLTRGDICCQCLGM